MINLVSLTGENLDFLNTLRKRLPNKVYLVKLKDPEVSPFVTKLDCFTKAEMEKDGLDDFSDCADGFLFVKDPIGDHHSIEHLAEIHEINL